MSNQNLFVALRDAFPTDLDRTAVETDDGLTYSWRDLDRATAMVANLLDSLELPAASRIAVQVEKSVEAMVLYLATLRAGHVFLPLNTAYQSAEIEYFIGNAEPAVVVCSPGQFGWVSKIAFTAGTRHVFTLGDDRTGSLLERAAHMSDRHTPAVRADDDLAAILYTSGTTGKPKGCLQSGSAVAASALGFAQHRRFTAHEVLLSVNPLFHVVGMQQIAAMLACGGTSVFAGRDDDSAAILDLLHREGCTTTSAFPTICFPWQGMEPIRDGKMPLTNYTGGAGMGRPQMYEFIEKDWDARVVGGYGQTEICGFATFMDYPDMLEAPRSIGWTLPLQPVVRNEISGMLLNAYGVVHWQIDNPHKVQIKAIAYGSANKGSSLSGSIDANSVKLELDDRISGHDQGTSCDCSKGRFNCSSEGLPRIIARVKELTGKNLYGFSGQHATAAIKTPELLITPTVLAEAESALRAVAAKRAQCKPDGWRPGDGIKLY